MYNENYNIVNLLKEISEIQIVSEIIVVDDCSTDNSLDLINKLYLNNLKIIKNKKNKGQSYSIFKGVTFAKNKIIMIMDSDGQNNPNYIPIFYKKLIESKNMMIMGKRINRTDTLSKKIQSFLGNYLRKIILNDNCTDSGCGMKIIYRDIFLQLHFINNMHRFMPYLLSLYNFKYDFIEIEDRKRKFGKSNYNIFHRIISLLYQIINISIYYYFLLVFLKELILIGHG